MSSSEPARHALYARLEDLLGVEHARTLMTHLPQQPSDEVTTKGDITLLKADLDQTFEQIDHRFDRLEDRFDRLEERLSSQQRFYVATTLGTLTAMTAIFSIVVGMIT
jgi:hypothetical protein